MFRSVLKAEKCGAANDRALWRLVAPLIYDSPVLGRQVVAPEGFVTDFASVPRLPLAYLLAGDTAHEAAVIHDYLYKYNTCTRAEADAVLDEASASLGEPWWRRQLMWTAVRVGGWVPWNRYRKGEK
jgi:hypothetical protein